MTVDHIAERRDFEYEWMLRTIARLEEREKRGDSEVNMQIREVIQLFYKLIGMSQRCDRLEKMLHELALYQIPAPQIITKSEVE